MIMLSHYKRQNMIGQEDVLLNVELRKSKLQEAIQFPANKITHYIKSPVMVSVCYTVYFVRHFK